MNEIFDNNTRWGIEARKLNANFSVIQSFELFRKTVKIRFLPFLADWKSTSKNSLTLCAMRTDIIDNKIPFHRGFLFHKLPTDDRKLFYGSKLDNAVEIGSVTDFYPKDKTLAMSPSDGRIIAAQRGNRGTMHIYDGTTTTPLFASAETKPMGWLYNSGVDFIKDMQGNEFCIFAEYSGTTTDKGGFYVWKGAYPYTSEENWKTVYHQSFQYDGTIAANTITHFHQIRRDPWTNILYLSSGDQPGQLKWWYSIDLGENWVLLTDNTTNGWAEHTCRCINFVFTKDYIYWATDHGINHTLNRIVRNETTGIIDISTRVKLCDLPYAQATNSICYIEKPNGILCFERIDVGAAFSSYYGGDLSVLFWSFDAEKLYTIAKVRLTNNSWGGHRGKCYSNYTNGQENRPGMGFSDDTRCVFDLIGADGINIGTIFYEI